jgi:hypothetical protein
VMYDINASTCIDRTMSVSEDIYSGEKGHLKFSVMDKQICSCCYINDVGIQCQCGKFICEACVPWIYKDEEKMSVIEAHCPVCMEIVYNDFY